MVASIQIGEQLAAMSDDNACRSVLKTMCKPILKILLQLKNLPTRGSVGNLIERYMRSRLGINEDLFFVSLDAGMAQESRLARMDVKVGSKLEVS